MPWHIVADVSIHPRINRPGFDGGSFSRHVGLRFLTVVGLELGRRLVDEPVNSRLALRLWQHTDCSEVPEGERTGKQATRGEVPTFRRLDMKGPE